MTRRIPDELVEEIRSANDIVDVISERIPVKRAGRNYRALCPFHQEKTPSFNINPERQIYHCFGCGMGGNVITFLMEHDKMGFLDAVQELADRAGIRLPARGGADGSEADDPIYRANEMALGYFRRSLREESGSAARAFIRDRGLSEEIVETFALGHALKKFGQMRLGLIGTNRMHNTDPFDQSKTSLFFSARKVKLEACGSRILVLVGWQGGNSGKSGCKRGARGVRS